ncbi:MAG: DUF2156 domain-containing protein [Acutalibacteraceae bacterium]|jgi:hypothetical protein
MIDTSLRLRGRALTAADAGWAVPLLKSRGFDGCELTFATLFLWRDFYHNELVEADGCLFIRSRDPHDPGAISFSAPLKGDLQTAIPALRQYARATGRPLTLYGSRRNLTDELERLFPGEFALIPSPEDFDYVYKAEDLRDLSGRRYHGKRGHIAAFSKRYDWRYEPVDDGNLSEVLAAADAWYAAHRPLDASLAAEQNGLRDLLRLRQKLDVRAGLIRVDGNVVAFTCGAPVSDEEFDVLIEKALPDYADAYPVINRKFVAHELNGFRYVNRENDMGLDGLRQAKLSYHPDHLIEKFVCVDRG